MIKSRRNKQNQSQDNQLDNIVPIAISAKPQRVSVRLFRTLSERLRAHRYNCPKMSDAEHSIAKAAFEKELTRKLRKTDKKVLIEMIITGMPDKAANTFGVKTLDDQQRELRTQHYTRHDNLIAQINMAELAFLAGDSEPAKALVEKVNAFIDASCPK